MRMGDEPEEPSNEPAVENGFNASFGKRRYVIQAVTQENPRHLRALVRAVGQTPGRFHLDAVDLYSSKDRTTFVRRPRSSSGRSRRSWKRTWGGS